MAALAALQRSMLSNGTWSFDTCAVAEQVSVPWSRLQYLNALAPAGGIDASIDEMTRYALLQLDGGMLSGRRVVSSEMMAELHRPGSSWGQTGRRRLARRTCIMRLGGSPRTFALGISSIITE